MLSNRVLFGLLALAFLISTMGCSRNAPYMVNLMPAPGVFTEGSLDPLNDKDISPQDLPEAIFYATDREPQDKPTTKEPYYKNSRGHILRVGKASITLGKNNMTWEEARQISLAKNRSSKYPLKVTNVVEDGIINASYSDLYHPEMLNKGMSEGEKRFLADLNSQLDRSTQKDIYIYVHGFKVNFENPILIASELWHYIGYDGAFIAYSWPSTPSIWAYASDAETTLYAAHNLRLFLNYLQLHSSAEKIHIIGYSAGTRLVATTLHQMALINHEKTVEENLREFRLGQVALIGSDMDSQLFTAYLAEGIWRLSDSLDIYISGKDQALSMSNWFFRRNRLGEQISPDSLTPEINAFLESKKSVRLIDVTDAENADNANGHAYFRDSPWVSSDLLVSLRFRLPPGKRGLVRKQDAPIWSFPDDYVSRLMGVLQVEAPRLFPAKNMQ